MRTSHKSFSKRSQMELLGFAVVIILIAVGMIFIISFSIMSPNVDSRTTYLHKQVATNLNDALLETTTTCRQESVRELLLSCVETNQMICPPIDSSITIDNTNACDYLSQFIQNRLNDTLDVWGYDYSYTIRYDTTTSQNFVIPPITNAPNGAKCGNQRSPLSVPGAERPIIIYLDIYDCSK